MTSDVTPERLRTLFRPRSVALVGASDKSMFSKITYNNLVQFGFAEKTYLVNRRGEEVHGQPTVTSCTAIDDDVDVAFLMVPQVATLDAMSDAAAAGIRNAVILSSGYGEAGEAGRAAEAELVAHAKSLDMILLGPNHLGFANFVDQIPVTSIPGLPRKHGPIALLSQSGASSGAMLDFATMTGNDLSYMVTLGNEAMITAGHVLDFLVDDEDTRAIAIFMETIRDPEQFRDAATRATRAGKAIVALKAGSSELAARTAAAHTGALVGDDATADAIFRDLGIIRVKTIEEMILTAGLAAHTGPIGDGGLGVVSISGGACDILADRAEEAGLPLPAISAEAHQRLTEIMPDYGTVQNPLDVTGAAVIDPSIFGEAIKAMAADPSVAVVAAVTSLPWQEGQMANEAMSAAIGDGMKAASVPAFLASQVLHPVTDVTTATMARTNIPHVTPGLGFAVNAVQGIRAWSAVHRRLQTEAAARVSSGVNAPPQSERRGSWSEFRAREMLQNAGVPVVPSVLAQNAAEAAEAALHFDAPLALKIVSPDILHKSDIGGVRLNVQGAEEARAAYAQILEAATSVPEARIEGVLVSPMRPAGVELLVGVVRDPQWGPMLAVALGGVFVEILKDSALSQVPLSPEQAKQLLLSLRAAPLLKGARGTEPADLDVLAATVAAVGDLAHELRDELESLEINPLLVRGAEVEALDALVTWRELDRTARTSITTAQQS